jgi:hypothetical protein
MERPKNDKESRIPRFWLLGLQNINHFGILGS